METRFFPALPRKSSDSSCVSCALPAARLTATTLVCGGRRAAPRTNSTRLWVCSQITLPAHELLGVGYEPSPSTLEELHFSLPVGNGPRIGRERKGRRRSRESVRGTFSSGPIPPFRSPLEQCARGAAFPGFCWPHRAFFLSFAVLTRAELHQRSAAGLSPTCAEPYPLRALA
jgi:hypothetical protein